jgi:N-acetylglucosamine malate deacetylase 2
MERLPTTRSRQGVEALPVPGLLVPYMQRRAGMEPCLLFCYAHPDDEAFSGTGTAMACATAGWRTVLVTATRGERGKAGDPPVCRPEDLAACREAELREAARIVGYDELHLLGYRDRELAEVPPDEIRRTLVALLRRVRPSVVATFDPNGFNGHPDHIAISRFTSDAIAAAADSRWERDTGKPHRVTRLLWPAPIAPWDAVRNTRLENEPGVDYLISVGRWYDRRLAALRAHRSQHLSIEKYFLRQPDVERILSTELWRQAWGPPLAMRPARELTP